MPKRLNADTYFNMIKENHKKYLEHNMVTHLEAAGGEHLGFIEKYTENLAFYHHKKTRYLNNATQQLSTSAKIGHGALAALIGAGAGGVAFLATNNNLSPIAFLNPLAGAGSLIAGTFSAALGVGVTALAYKAWQASAENPAGVNLAEFESMMQSAGFTNEKYAQLSEELVRLFHFRECVLLGLADNSGTNMRAEFKKDYPADYTDETLNAAIEVYFLAQLNKLFNNAFRDIYQIHEQEIQDDKNEHPVLSWIKRYFNNPQERQKFTQKMQIEFMEQCLGFLEKEMLEPSFFAKYPYATASIGGLIAGAAVLGLATLIIGGPITLGIASIALVVACLTAVPIYFSINNIESLKFARSAENRSAIKSTIENISKEVERLKSLVQKVVETSPEDITQAGKFKSQGAEKGWVDYILNRNTEVAMGAATAWVRDYASRYRHSKAIEIDLQKEQKDIINQAVDQTSSLQDALKLVQSSANADNIPRLRDYIVNTRAYLSKLDNQEFIKNFGLVEKIKQQVLEIVAVVPAGGYIPQDLVTFYTSPIAEGGLGGLAQDLSQVNKLAPVVDEAVAPDKKHPYSLMLVAAQRFDDALHKIEKESIFLGDAQYRAMLGLPIESGSERMENKISSANIEEYLNSSFNFLYSLNKSSKVDSANNLDTPFNNSNEFILYRTLLIKQLANLYDSNNLGVDSEVRSKIEKFVEKKLLLNAKIVLDNALNQMLFIEPDQDGPRINSPLEVPLSVEHLGYVADVIRVDLAYASKPMTPSMFIELEASSFLVSKAQKTIFSHHNSSHELRVAHNPKYAELIKQTIETTHEFVSAMSENNGLVKSGALSSYLHGVLREVQTLKGQISNYEQLDSKSFRLPFEPFIQAKVLLQEYENELNIMLNKVPVNLLNSFLNISEFGKNSIDLSVLLNDFEPLQDSINDLNSWVSVSIDASENVPALVENNVAEESSENPPVQNLADSDLSLSMSEFIDIGDNLVDAPIATSAENSAEEEPTEHPNVPNLAESDLNSSSWVMMERSVALTKETAESTQSSVKNALDNFIASLGAYIEGVTREPNSYGNFFGGYSKSAKLRSATLLNDALKALREGHSVDTAFLANGIYSNGRLKDCIHENLEQLGCDSLGNLFELHAPHQAVVSPH